MRHTEGSAKRGHSVAATFTDVFMLLFIVFFLQEGARNEVIMSVNDRAKFRWKIRLYRRVQRYNKTRITHWVMSMSQKESAINHAANDEYVDNDHYEQLQLYRMFWQKWLIF